MKTSELTGAALDWAVAKCEGFTDFDPDTEKMLQPRREYGWVHLCDYQPSSEWSQGGPIIEREKTRLVFRDLGVDSYWLAEAFEAYNGDQYISGRGPTPLVAAMRCHVASKLGYEVDVPEGLT